MSSRSDKERKLKHNVEVNTERAYREEMKKRGGGSNSKVKDHFRKGFEESARRIDKTKLHEVWND